MVLCGWKGSGGVRGFSGGLDVGLGHLPHYPRVWKILTALSPLCADCDCSFKGRCKLREHLRSHTQEKVVACPTCGGMFANNTKFFDHIRRQTALDREQLPRAGGGVAGAARGSRRVGCGVLKGLGRVVWEKQGG